LEKPKKLIDPNDYVSEDEEEEEFEDLLMTREEIRRAVANSDHLLEKARAYHSAKKQKAGSSKPKPSNPYDPIQAAVDQTPGLTYEKAEEIAKLFGF